MPIEQPIATAKSSMVIFGYSPAQLLTFINEVRIWAVAVTAMAGLITFAASYYQIRLQSIVSTDKDAQFQTFRLSTEERTEALRVETSKAQAEQESIRNDNLKLGVELEKERQQRIRLELQLAPRDVTKTQAEKLKTALSKGPKPFSIQISVVDHPEAQKYASRLADIFQSAGVSIPSRVTMMGGGADGLFIIAKDGSTSHAQTAAAAFLEAGIATTNEIGQCDADVHLVVGFKP